MEPWLQSATEYIRSWIEFQVRASQQPGCIVAIAHRGKVVAEYAFGHANLVTGEKLTPRHRFRVASHSKSFTTEIEVTGRDTGRISLAAGYGSHGEAVHRTRNKAGKVTEVWFAGGKGTREKAVAAEMERRYEQRKRRPVR